jgi:cytoskeletal protein RodZ
MLQAMESGDLSKLPGGVFTKSFLKQYANILGLDPAYVDAELRNLSIETPLPSPPPESKSFTPFESLEPKSTSLTSATVWVVLALVGSGAVYYFARGFQTGATWKPNQSATVTKPESTPVAAKSPEPAPITAVSQPTVPAIGAGSLEVVVNASEQTWVSVTVDGKLLFSGILQPNERREIKAEEKVKIVAGNAGGLDISLNGKNIDSLGPKGQVRTVELTRTGAQVLSRTPNPAPLL